MGIGFDQIIGQEMAKRVLSRAVREGSPTHAYLFLGPEGSGKTTTAIEFAKALNCENPRDGHACGECAVCRSIEHGNLPEVRMWSPDRKKQKQDTTIDQMREMREFAMLRPVRSRWKVNIVEEGDTLNEESSNCILKLLEEPPGYLVNTLIFRNASNALPTIRSRCQLVRFTPVSAAELVDRLLEEHGATNDQARFLATYSQGCPGRAIRLMEDPTFFDRRDAIADVAGQAASGNPWSALKLAEEVMSFIEQESVKASEDLATVRGPFPNFPKSVYAKKGVAVRNATTTTIAPTGTISIICGASSGIEPLFSIAFTRHVLDRALIEVNPRFEEALRLLGLYSDDVMQKIAAHGSLAESPDLPPELRNAFVTAHEISPEWHIRMQAAFQKHTHNAVSKTVNFPHEATKEDVARVYRLAYRLGCKGVTVYRDRSRESQVLNVGGSADKKQEAAPPAGADRSELTPRPRPEVTIGSTSRLKTGCGNLYVTVNEDEQGLCEVFATMGKSGGCAASQSEAVARLISLALRSGLEVESVIKELRGIRCPSPAWRSGGMVLSCPDAIGIILERYVKDKHPGATSAGQAAPRDDHLVSGLDSLDNHTGACPECGGHVKHQNGCITCSFCGYSKCG